jgi:protein-L-isoaspartate O-methyltransferase
MGRRCCTTLPPLWTHEEKNGGVVVVPDGDSHSHQAHVITEAAGNLTLVQYDEVVSFLYLVLVLIKFLILPALSTAFSFHSK